MKDLNAFYFIKLAFFVFFLKNSSSVCFCQSIQTGEKRWETVKNSFNERNAILYEIYDWALLSGKINSSVLLPVKKYADSLNYLLKPQNKLNALYFQRIGKMDSVLVSSVNNLKEYISEHLYSGNSVRLLALLDRAEKDLQESINAYNGSLTKTEKKDLFYFYYKTNP